MSLLIAALTLSKDDPTQWAVLCAGILATCYLVMRGRAKGKQRSDPMARPAGLGVSQQRQVERDISALIVEMLETARQMVAQLDTRAMRVEVLIKEADAKLAALKTAMTEAGGTAIRSDNISTHVEAPVVPSVKPEAPPDPRHGEIYALADQGKSPQDIARQLRRPDGEVQLILALRSH